MAGEALPCGANRRCAPGPRAKAPGPRLSSLVSNWVERFQNINSNMTTTPYSVGVDTDEPVIIGGVAGKCE